MCNVELPCRGSCPEAFGQRLYRKHGFFTPTFDWAGSGWMRLTLAVYNEMADVHVVGKAVLDELGG